MADQDATFLVWKKNAAQVETLLRANQLSFVCELFNEGSLRYRVTCSDALRTELEQMLRLDSDFWKKHRHFVMVDNERRKETRDQLAKVDRGYTYEYWDECTDCYHFTCTESEASRLIR